MLYSIPFFSMVKGEIAVKWKKELIVLINVLLCSFAVLTGCEDIAIEDTAINDIIIEDIENEYDDIETVEVASVVDGDTIKVYLEGERYTIRMIGIDTPESVHPDESKNTIYGQKASDYAKQTIKKG